MKTNPKRAPAKARKKKAKQKTMLAFIEGLDAQAKCDPLIVEQIETQVRQSLALLTKVGAEQRLKIAQVIAKTLNAMTRAFNCVVFVVAKDKSDEGPELPIVKASEANVRQAIGDLLA